MFSLVQLVITLVAVVIAVIIKWYKKPPRFPPGSCGIPLLGVLPYMGKNYAETFKKWSLEKYGAIMFVKIGVKKVTTLNTYKSINEVFVKQGHIASGRIVSDLFKRLFDERGILFRDSGENYRRQRSFGLKALRGLGFKKDDMERMICNEASNLVEEIRKNCGSPTDILPKLNQTSANVIGAMVFGKSFDAKDEKYTDLLNSIHSLLYEQQTLAVLAMIFVSWLSYFPPFSTIAKRMMRNVHKTQDMMQTFVDEHKASFDPNNIRDFIDAYIYEQKFGDGKDQPGFDDQQLTAFIRDLFAAGTETTASSLYWAIATLLNFPQYEQLIIEEIQSVVGVGEPSLQHRNKLPITNAFLQEVWRVYPPVTVTGHSSHCPIEVDGYVIPPNTRIFANLWGANHDPDSWPDPHKFNPYRHIDEAGEFVHSSKIISFFIGPRSCLGESLARNEYFLIFVKFMQSYRFRHVGDAPPSLDCTGGLIVQRPVSYQIILEER